MSNKLSNPELENLQSRLAEEEKKYSDSMQKDEQFAEIKKIQQRIKQLKEEIKSVAQKSPTNPSNTRNNF